MASQSVAPFDSFPFPLGYIQDATMSRTDFCVLRDTHSWIKSPQARNCSDALPAEVCPSARLKANTASPINLIEPQQNAVCANSNSRIARVTCKQASCGSANLHDTGHRSQRHKSPRIFIHSVWEPWIYFLRFAQVLSM